MVVATGSDRGSFQLRFFCDGLVSAILSAYGNNMGVYVVAARSLAYVAVGDPEKIWLLSGALKAAASLLLTPTPILSKVFVEEYSHIMAPRNCRAMNIPA